MAPNRSGKLVNPHVSVGSFASPRHIRLRSGLGTIPDIFAGHCRTNLSAPK
jgi:hypothetical protein